MYQERRRGLRTMRWTTTRDTQSHWLGRRIMTAAGKQNSNWGRIWERHHGYREIITARSSCLARAARTNTSDMWLGSQMRDIKVSQRPRSTYAMHPGVVSRIGQNGGGAHPTLPPLSNRHSLTGAEAFTHGALAREPWKDVAIAFSVPTCAGE